MFDRENQDGYEKSVENNQEEKIETNTNQGNHSFTGGAFSGNTTQEYQQRNVQEEKQRNMQENERRSMQEDEHRNPQGYFNYHDGGKRKEDVEDSRWQDRSENKEEKREQQESGIYHYSYRDNRNDQWNNKTNILDHEKKGKGKKEKNNTKGGLLRKLVSAVLIGVFFGAGVGGSFLLITQMSGDNQVAVEEVAVIEETVEEEIAAVIAEAEVINETQVVTSTVVTDVTEVVEAVMPSVVSITSSIIETQSFMGQTMESEATSSGSGIIIGENETELLIVTNNHVVEDTTVLTVQFIDETTAEAKIKGTDSDMDLAVIAVKLEELDEETLESIVIATLGDSDSLKVGEPAIAIGNALGYGQSVTTGVISAINRSFTTSADDEDGTTLIQTDAAINPGNSGGALLNINGEVIGINSSKIGDTVVEGMGYAIPISAATPIIEELMILETKEKVDTAEKGYLGISGINVTSDVSEAYGIPMGAYVAQATEGYAAADAGIVKGDIIVGFEGEDVTCMEDLQGYLEYYAIGDTVEVVLQRIEGSAYQEKTVTVTLGESTASVVVEEETTEEEQNPSGR